MEAYLNIYHSGENQPWMWVSLPHGVGSWSEQRGESKRIISLHFSLLPNCKSNVDHHWGCDFPPWWLNPQTVNPKDSFLPQVVLDRCFVTRTRQITNAKGLLQLVRSIDYFQNSLCRFDGVYLQFQRSRIQTQSEKVSRDFISQQKKQGKYFMLRPLADGVAEPEGIVQLQSFRGLRRGAIFLG